MAGILMGTLLMGTVLVTDGCSVSQDQTKRHSTNDKIEETNTDTDLTVVGVSQIGSESVWRTANSKSIQNTMTTENGYYLIFDNARQKQENQIKAIRRFISRQVDYIVFSPITEEGWNTVLQEAKDAGIPVILMDRRLHVEDESLYTTWVGSDFNKEGVEAGEWLEDHLAQQGRTEEDVNIVILQGTAGATSEIGRTTGFDSVLANNKNWKVLEQTDADYTTAKGKEVMEHMLQTYPDIDVVVAQNDDMMFGAMEALDQAGITTGVDGEVIVISFDAVKAALSMVKTGQINVDIECNPEQGPYIEQVIQSLEKGKKVKKENYIPEKIFTQENVDQFITKRTY